MAMKNIKKITLPVMILIGVLFSLPITAQALSLKGDAQSVSPSKGGGSSSGSTTSYSFYPHLQTIWKKSNATTPGSVVSVRADGYYSQKTRTTDEPHVTDIRGNSGIADHWEVYMFAPKKTNAKTDSDYQVYMWGAQSDGSNAAKSYGGSGLTSWMAYWHKYYWGASSAYNGENMVSPSIGTLANAGNYTVTKHAMGAPRPSVPSDGHVHGDGKYSKAVYVNGEYHHVLEALGNKTKIFDVSGSSVGGSAPHITFDAGVLAQELTNPEGKYSAAMFLIGTRGEVRNAYDGGEKKTFLATSEQITRPRVKTVIFYDTNNNGIKDANEPLADDANWSLSLPTKSWYGTSFTLSNIKSGVEEGSQGYAAKNGDITRGKVLPNALINSKNNGYKLTVNTASPDIIVTTVSCAKTNTTTKKVYNYTSLLGNVSLAKNGTSYTLNGRKGTGVSFGGDGGELSGGNYVVSVALASGDGASIVPFYDKDKDGVRDDGEKVITDNGIATSLLGYAAGATSFSDSGALNRVEGSITNGAQRVVLEDSSAYKLNINAENAPLIYTSSSLVSKDGVLKKYTNFSVNSIHKGSILIKGENESISRSTIYVGFVAAQKVKVRFFYDKNKDGFYNSGDSVVQLSKTRGYYNFDWNNDNRQIAVQTQNPVSTIVPYNFGGVSVVNAEITGMSGYAVESGYTGKTVQVTQASDENDVVYVNIPCLLNTGGAGVPNSSDIIAPDKWVDTGRTSSISVNPRTLGEGISVERIYVAYPTEPSNYSNDSSTKVAYDGFTPYNGAKNLTWHKANADKETGFVGIKVPSGTYDSLDTIPMPEITRSSTSADISPISADFDGGLNYFYAILYAKTVPVTELDKNNDLVITGFNTTYTWRGGYKNIKVYTSGTNY